MWTNVWEFLLNFFFNDYLEIYSSFVGQIRFVSCQCDNNIRAGLSLQLFHPVLCTCECILHNKKKRKKNDDWCRFYMLHMTGRAIREQSSAAVSEVRNHQPTLEDSGRFKLSSDNVLLMSCNVLCWWCRTPRWRPGLPCSTWVQGCDTVPALRCPRSRTWPLYRPNIPSVWGRRLERK